MTNGNILISGAGVAGLSLAYWLRRYGFTPTVVERASAPRTGGQAVDVRGVARQVVERMGLTDAVRRHHTGTRGFVFLDAAGNRAAAMGAEAFGDSGGIVADVEILREDLVRILHQAAGPEVEYLFGDAVTDLAADGDAVKASFAHGPTRSFDVVVGADGLRSGVRRIAFGDDARFVRDLGYYQAYFPAVTGADLDGWELMYNLPAGNGVGGRAAFLYPLGTDRKARAMLAFASPPLRYEQCDSETQKEILVRVFADGGWELPGLVEQLRRTDQLYFDRVGAVRLDQWSTGRVVLLGDAVFAGSVGMGTSMALVGGYVLAGELAASGGDHQAAFAGYRDAMRRYVEVNQKRPPGGVNGFLPPTRRRIWMRNQFMRALPHLPGGSRMLGGIQKAANAITLKAYP